MTVIRSKAAAVVRRIRVRQGMRRVLACAAWIVFFAAISLSVRKLAGAGRPIAISDRPPEVLTPATTSYELDVQLDPTAHRLEGTGVIRWTNRSRIPQDRVYVHLYLNAFREGSVYASSDGSGFRGGRLGEPGSTQIERFYVREHDVDIWDEEARSEGHPSDQTDIRLNLTRSVAPGETITIDVEFVADLPEVVLRTGYAGSFHMVAQWFPKIARLEKDGTWAHFPLHRFSEFYSDFGDYDVTIEVPESFVVGATGQRVESEIEDGTKRLRFEARSVHDFAFAAWDEFERIERRTERGVLLTCLYPPGYEGAAEAQLNAAERGLAFLGERFGAYPYGTLTLVHPPPTAGEAGGMEYPTLITTGGSWLAPQVGVRAVEIVTLHELAHQWFYGLVATNEYRHPMLDEGLTTYAEIHATRELYGGPLAFLDVAPEALYRTLAADAAHHGPIERPASEFATGQDYGRLVYFRTATVLRTLERVFGDGVTRGIEAYARDHRFQHPSPDDLYRSLAVHAPVEAAEVARSALSEGGWIDLEVESIEAHDEPGADGIYRGTAVIRQRGDLRLPFDVDLYGEDGSLMRKTVTSSEAVIRIAYEGASPLEGVVIDPEVAILLDQDLFNNAARRSRSRIAIQTWQRAAFGFLVAGLGVGP